MRKRQTHCKRGHELSGDNVIYYVVATCRTCKNAYQRKHMAKRRDAERGPLPLNQELSRRARQQQRERDGKFKPSDRQLDRASIKWLVERGIR